MERYMDRNEMFTFVVCTHIGHAVDYVYCNRKEADLKFDQLVASHASHVEGLSVAYYCPSVGGLVNAWHA